MKIDDIEILDYFNVQTKGFTYWVRFRDRRNSKDSKGRKGRLTFIRYLESFYGKIGDRWFYQKENDSTFIVKFNQESDLLIFLLKYKRG